MSNPMKSAAAFLSSSANALNALTRRMVTKPLFFICLLAVHVGPRPVASLANEGAIHVLSALKPRDLSGVWCLTHKESFLPSGKNAFASNLGDETNDGADDDEEIILKLCPDGSFFQCAKDTYESDTETDENEMSSAGNGVWDYVDGKLLVAPNRPQDADWRKVHDTLLVGEVVCQLGDGMSTMEGAAGKGSQRIRASRSSEDAYFSRSPRDVLAAEEYEDEGYERPISSFGTDVFLTVPEGSIEVGKFMYPRHHRLFFEQSMHESTITGTFQLRQILGALNTNSLENGQDGIPREKFRFEDIQGKRFFLMSRPLREEGRRGNRSQERENNALTVVPINVKEVELFPNCTFATVAGVGSSTVLRGKWDLFGDERDQLWMKVSRFGLGRSVSGSVYSEGSTLSHDDAKTYWGEIKRVRKYKGASGDVESKLSTKESITVDGTVFIGGLSAEPIAKFSMVEDLDDASVLVGEEVGDDEEGAVDSEAFQ